MLEVLRSGQLSLGPTGPRFEALLADAVGAPYCAAVSSGTAGLHLCMRLAGVGPGDEVITSPYSFVASANCAIYEGATPVFADIDPRTLQPRPGGGRGGDHAADEGDRRGRHLRLSVRARRADARSASGTASRSSRTRARRSARATRAARSARTAIPPTFAFYPNKQMTTGEGGAVTTGSAEEHELLDLAAQPGPPRDVELAPARPPRLQLPARRHLGRARHRPAREARPDPGRARARWRRATASCSRASTSSCRSPTTPTTSARGSSTSSSCRAASTATA